MNIAKTLTALAAAAITTAAMAAVTFDSTTGTGFVGKGDVQLAFGWNNNTLQTNAGGVGFVYDQTTNYSYTCVWTTGEGTKGEKTHTVSQKKTSVINSIVTYDARTRNQVNGFNLNGWGVETVNNPVPSTGDACLGDGANGEVTAVNVIGMPIGGLYVTHGGTSVLLQP